MFDSNIEVDLGSLILSFEINKKSQFPKPLKVSDTDHWLLVAARHEEKKFS